MSRKAYDRAYLQGITARQADKKPDGSKLQRSTEDALTDAGLWRDDARVVEWIGVKAYPGEHPDALHAPGARIRVEVIA